MNKHKSIYKLALLGGLAGLVGSVMMVFYMNHFSWNITVGRWHNVSFWDKNIAYLFIFLELTLLFAALFTFLGFIILMLKKQNK